jgi:nicotinamidase-related amidase
MATPAPAATGRPARRDQRECETKASTLWAPERSYGSGDRPWASGLSTQDRALLAATTWAKAGWFGLGRAPALLLVDVYQAAAGPRGLPLLEAVRTYPAACGPAAWDALTVIAAVLRTARRCGIPVVHATALPGGYSPWNPKKRRGVGARHQAQPDGAWDLVADCAPSDGELVLHKGTPSAFASTSLRGVLRDLGCDSVVVAGESTSGCVRGTVVDGRCEGFAMAVVEDGCFDRFESSHRQSLFDLDQKYADVITATETESYLRSVTCV